MPESFLKFWGVRGSIPTPCPENVGFGGNTACIELHSGGETFVIDGGTGARNLGLHLQKTAPAGSSLPIHFLLTHFHWDHVQGLPFFAPLYDERNQVTFYSGCEASTLRAILEGQMAAPYFPVHFELLAAQRRFVQLRETGEPAGTAQIHPFPLHHPQGATGFRIRSNGVTITHASDFEHGVPHFDHLLREYARDADVLIYDAQYTREEYERRKGWGHSTWLEATRVARESNVKRLVLFHHDPSHDDEFVTRIEAQAREHFPHTNAAKEGWQLDL